MALLQRPWPLNFTYFSLRLIPTFLLAKNDWFCSDVRLYFMTELVFQLCGLFVSRSSLYFYINVFIGVNKITFILIIFFHGCNYQTLFSDMNSNLAFVALSSRSRPLNNILKFFLITVWPLVKVFSNNIMLTLNDSNFNFSSLFSGFLKKGNFSRPNFP